MGFGKEDGDAADGGDCIGEEEPGGEEENDVGETPGELHSAVQRQPGVSDIA